ncbi:MAG: LytR family transcriptional regulator, partial [Mycobacterium sp.]|nr:LytR family transcriptional regulator [Mycobacterium sp.]
MSDGENATPGQTGGPPGDERVIPPPQPRSAKPPWERDHVPGTPTGTHSEGVAVADLIAKITGEQGANPAGRRGVDVAPADQDAT